MSDVEALAPYLGPIVTALITAGGVYAAITNRITRLETKIDVLTEQVEKHNRIVERTYKLETEANTLWHRYDELREELKGK